jgi:hypothetical protein
VRSDAAAGSALAWFLAAVSFASLMTVGVGTAAIKAACLRSRERVEALEFQIAVRRVERRERERRLGELLRREPLRERLLAFLPLGIG